MPAKNDPAADLATHMVQVLEAQRRLGPDSYPLALRRLAELTDPTAPEELVLKAAGKKKQFKDQVILARPKDLDFPVALTGDLEALAGSPPVFQFAADRTFRPDAPTCKVSDLKAKLPAKLKRPFDQALAEQLRVGRLPPGVEVVGTGAKERLHLTRYPLPRPPDGVLAETLVGVLRERRAADGTDAYPVPLSVLKELARPAAAAALVKKATALPAYRDAVVTVFKQGKDPVVALAGDRDTLAAGEWLVESALRRTRTGDNQLCDVKKLAQAVDPGLRPAFGAALERRIESGTVPPRVGCLRLRGKPLLFLLGDVRSEPRPPASAPPADFARAFDDAFDRLERLRGLNFVSLVDLRRELPVDRPAFDAGLASLRRAGRYTLGGAEGRHGLTPDEQRAGIPEDGSFLLHVSRKLP